MAKDTTRKKALKIFHTILKAKRTDESNPSLCVQRRVLKKKMQQAKKRALREQREKQAELDKIALAAQVKPEIVPVCHTYEDGKVTVALTGDSGSTIQTKKYEHRTLTDAHGLPVHTFKEIIKHGGF